MRPIMNDEATKTEQTERKFALRLTRETLTVLRVRSSLRTGAHCVGANSAQGNTGVPG
jgi:hypothetical protein